VIAMTGAVISLIALRAASLAANPSSSHHALHVLHHRTVGAGSARSYLLGTEVNRKALRKLFFNRFSARTTRQSGGVVQTASSGRSTRGEQ
jgi:hypothetical protein